MDVSLENPLYIEPEEKILWIEPFQQQITVRYRCILELFVKIFSDTFQLESAMLWHIPYVGMVLNQGYVVSRGGVLPKWIAECSKLLFIKCQSWYIYWFHTEQVWCYVKHIWFHVQLVPIETMYRTFCCKKQVGSIELDISRLNSRKGIPVLDI